MMGGYLKILFTLPTVDVCTSAARMNINGFDDRMLPQTLLGTLPNIQ